MGPLRGGGDGVKPPEPQRKRKKMLFYDLKKRPEPQEKQEIFFVCYVHASQFRPTEKFY